MVAPNQRILVSAPGKVILFGEHAVVYQKVFFIKSIFFLHLMFFAFFFFIKTAVAASLGLRSYLYLEYTDDTNVRLNLPDLNIEKSWKLEELPLGVDYPNSGTHTFVFFFLSNILTVNFKIPFTLIPCPAHLNNK